MMANFDPSLPLPSLESSLRQPAVAIAPVPNPEEPTTPAPERPGDGVTPPRTDDDFVLYGRLGYVLRSRVNHA